MVDLEHFYDGCISSGYRGEQYALMCLRTAAAAGASTVVLCDTNGGTMPWIVEVLKNTRPHQIHNMLQSDTAGSMLTETDISDTGTT
eukprot:7426363-Pyramimonas_sp.AAC.1